MWTLLGGAAQPIAHDGLLGAAQHSSAQDAAEEARNKATVSHLHLRLPRFDPAGEGGQGLSAPSCFPRDRCQMPAPRARGSPGTTWPPRTRGDMEQGGGSSPASRRPSRGAAILRCGTGTGVHTVSPRGDEGEHDCSAEGSGCHGGASVSIWPTRAEGQPEQEATRRPVALEPPSRLRHSGSAPNAFGPNDQVTRAVGGRGRHTRAHPDGASGQARRQDVLQTGGRVCLPSRCDSHRRLPGRSRGAAGPRPARPRPGCR